MAWNDESLAKAKTENKPILVSIGYSTCHWCHVMEHESFENQEVADYMNLHFINIKIDREERPDLDQIYMEACVAINGNGGWPLNCFLMPDTTPYFAGTYYPPSSAYGRPSWMEVLKKMSFVFQNDYKTVQHQSKQLIELIRNKSKTIFENNNENDFKSKGVIHHIYNELVHRFDIENGGFGLAPKFPSTFSLDFLLHYFYYSGEKFALRHVEFSLQKMIKGGIYDHLAGGFSRYTVDEAWKIPHFEKMLYDNALIIGLLADTYKVTKNEMYKEVIIQSLSFIASDFTADNSLFYAAYDADSEGVEGKYYVWQKHEIDTILAEHSEWFCELYQITEEGNWEENNIIYQIENLKEFATKKGLSPVELSSIIETCKSKLLAYRVNRIPPSLDYKHILSWNCMMVVAYTKAYEALQIESYKITAENTLNKIMLYFKNEKQWYHVFTNGSGKIQAFIDDLAGLLEAQIAVYQITANKSYILEANLLCQSIIDNYFDEKSNYFLFNDFNQKDILINNVEIYDNATPSGNSTMLINLVKLNKIFPSPKYATIIDQMSRSIQSAVLKYPTSFGKWATALSYIQESYYEVVITGSESYQLHNDILEHYIPNKVILSSVQKTDYTILFSEKNFDKELIVYLCNNFECLVPMYDKKSFFDILQIHDHV